MQRHIRLPGFRGRLIRKDSGLVRRARQTGGRGAGRNTRSCALPRLIAAIVPAMRVTRRRVIVDRHQVAEKFDDDEGGPDDRRRTAGHDASLVPEPPENRETAPSWRRGPRYNSALPAPAGAGQCRVLHRRAPDLLNSSQAHPEKPVTSRGFFGLCGYCAGARAGPAGLECGGNRTARARTAKEKKVAASIPWGDVEATGLSRGFPLSRPRGTREGRLSQTVLPGLDRDGACSTAATSQSA